MPDTPHQLLPVTIANLLEALACDCDEGENNDWEEYEWQDAASLLRQAAAALSTRSPANPEQVEVVAELRDLLAQEHDREYSFRNTDAEVAWWLRANEERIIAALGGSPR
jgi:hypothetical protein